MLNREIKRRHVFDGDEKHRADELTNTNCSSLRLDYCNNSCGTFVHNVLGFMCTARLAIQKL